MVIERTKQTIEDLKTRPRHERLAVAGWVALAVVCVLFIGWAIVFLQSIRGIAASPAPDASQAASAAASDSQLLQSAQAALQAQEEAQQDQSASATTTPSSDDIQATQGDTSPDMQVDMTSTTTSQ